jgi:hypothetical protein
VVRFRVQPRSKGGETRRRGWPCQREGQQGDGDELKDERQ